MSGRLNSNAAKGAMVRGASRGSGGHASKFGQNTKVDGLIRALSISTPSGNRPPRLEAR